MNEALARRFWPGESALGKVVRFKDRMDQPLEVVGVVADYRVRTIGEGAVPYIHLAAEQRADSYQLIFARTSGDARQLLAQMRRTLLDLEPNLVFLDNQTMETQITTTLLPVLAGVWLASGAGGAGGWPWPASASTVSWPTPFPGARGRSACAWPLAPTGSRWCGSCFDRVWPSPSRPWPWEEHWLAFWPPEPHARSTA